MFVAAPIKAAPGINEEVNFQGRLLTAEGATVPDGFYNIQFKIYQDGDGQSVDNTTGSPAGTLKWTESHLNSDGQGVTVKNGYMSVQLGSINPFGTQVDWNQDTIWLSMNIASTNAACTPFSACTPDGEMLPMKRLSSTPFALNSQRLGGLDWSKFIQIAPQAVQIDSSTLSTLFLNKTGASGNIVQLQKNGSDVLAIDNSGDVIIGTADTTGSVLVLDTKTDAGDPTGSDGAMYYNANTGTFRCYQASAWTDCITVVSTTLQQAYDNSSSPATITTTAATKGIVFRSGAGFDGTLFDVQDASGSQLLTVDSANNAVIVGNVASGAGNPAAAALYFGDTCSNFTQTCVKIAEFGGTDSDNLQLHGAGGLTFTTNYASEVPVMTISTTGQITMQNRTDSPTAFRVQNLSDATLFTVDTQNNRVEVGDGATSVDLDVSGSAAAITLLQNGNNVCDNSNNCSYQASGNYFVQDGNSFGGLATLGTNDNFGLAFETNGAEAMRIDAFGNVGIGTTTPEDALSVVGNFSVRDIDSATPNKQVMFNTTASGLTMQIGGSDLTIATWANGNFSSTAQNQITFDSAGGNILLHREANVNYFLNPNSYGLNVGGGINFTQWNDSTIQNVLFNIGEDAGYIFKNNNASRDLLTLLANGDIRVGTADTTGSLLMLDTKTTAGDPAGVDGAMYYNSSTGTFRCYQNGGWINCAGSGGSGVNTIGTIDSQTKSTNGAVISASTLYLQSADTTNPGLVTAGTQTFGGDKTFSGSTFQVTDGLGTAYLQVDTTNNTLSIGNTGNATSIQIGNTSGAVTQEIYVGNNATAGSTSNVTIGSSSGGVTTIQSAGGIALANLGTASSATYLCLNVSGIIATCGTSGGGGTGLAFVQDGNSFGGTAVLGTNDLFNLRIETNNVVRATFDTNGNLYLGDGITSASPLNGSVIATGSTAAGVAGATLSLRGGAGATTGTGSNGGDLLLQGGDAGGSGNNSGGDITLQAGSATGTGVGGSVIVKNAINSAVAFQVQRALGDSVFGVDTANSRVTLGTPNALSGLLTFYHSGGSGSTTLQAANPSSSAYNITLPTLDGTVCLTSGNCSGVGGNGDILQGGNSFGTTVTLGSNDSFGIDLETNNTTRLKITSGGNVGIGLGGTAPAELLHVGAQGGSTGSLISTPDNGGDISPVGETGQGFFAQSFIAQTSVINRFGVNLDQDDSQGQVKLAIAPDDGSGNPDEDNPLYTGPLVDPTTANQWFYEEELNIPVTQGTKYWVLIDGYQNAGATGATQVAQSTQFTNTSENFVYSLDGGSWTTYSNPLAVVVEDTGKPAVSALFDGAIGIGTTTPETELHVMGTICADDPGTTASCTDAAAGDREAGDIVAEGNITGNGFDIAETFNGDPAVLTPGTLVALDKNGTGNEVVQTSGKNDAAMLGIVSTDPGLKLTDLAGNHADDIPVALAGRVPTKVNSENGAIEPGDMITASSAPGVGMKATEPGRVVGMALEGYSGSDVGTITVFVNPHTWIATFAPEDLQGIPIDADDTGSSNVTTDTPDATTSQNDATTEPSGSSVQGSDGSFSSLNVSGPATVDSLAVTGSALIGGDLTVAGAITTGDLKVKGTLELEGDIKLAGKVNNRQATIKEFVASKAIKAGDVVILDGDKAGQVTTTETLADTRIIGVAVTDAAKADDKIEVAISGSVQVRVPESKDPDEEVVTPGQLLVTSADEGIAQASDTPPVGSVLGKATSKPDDDNLVWVLITLN